MNYVTLKRGVSNTPRVKRLDFDDFVCIFAAFFLSRNARTIISRYEIFGFDTKENAAAFISVKGKQRIPSC